MTKKDNNSKLTMKQGAMSASDEFALKQSLANIRLEGLTVSDYTIELVTQSLIDGTFDPDILIEKIINQSNKDLKKMTNKVYRGIAKENHSTELIHHFETKRAPSNIPYLVDNIWEWMRPSTMPSRRTSVYASPQKELALKYATSNDYVCSIKFEKNVNMVQLTDYQDAKLHPEVKSIPKLILNHLGQNWLDSDLVGKKELGQLFIPLLSKDEADFILSTPEMQLLKISLIDHVNFWNDIKTIDDQIELTDGELFFYAEDGYYLEINDF